MASLEKWLAHYASDNPAVKHRAARALLRRSDEVPLEILLDMLDDLSQEGLGVDAVGALQEWRDPALVGKMIVRLASPDTTIREAACQVLGRSENSAALPHLTKRLDDPALRVRRAAAFALGWLKDPAAIPALERQLARRRNDDMNMVIALRSALCDLSALRQEEVFAFLRAGTTRER